MKKNHHHNLLLVGYNICLVAFAFSVVLYPQIARGSIGKIAAVINGIVSVAAGLSFYQQYRQKNNS